MKISIIVPVYNTRPGYLARCLNSALEQDGPEKEIIVINDGSTNGIGELIGEYARRYPEILYIDAENGGTSRARNRGLDAAGGDYVCFLDSDDYLESGILAKISSEMERQQVDMLLFGYSTSYSNRVVRRVLDAPENFTWDSESLELAVLEGSSALGPVEVGAPWGKLIRRGVIEDNSLRYTPGLIKGQDTVFIIELFEYCRSFAYLKEAGYYYRVSDSSVSHRYNPDIVGIMEATLSAYGRFVRRYRKNGRFIRALAGKYYRVMMGEYLQLYFLHPENPDGEEERRKAYLELSRRNKYRRSAELIDVKRLGAYDRLLHRLAADGRVGLLFALKRMEFFLRDTVVRKYV